MISNFESPSKSAFIQKTAVLTAPMIIRWLQRQNNLEWFGVGRAVN